MTPRFLRDNLTRSDRLWIVMVSAVIASVSVATAVVCLMSWFFNGEVTYDYVVTGMVASALTSVAVVSIILFFVKQLQHAQRVVLEVRDQLEERVAARTSELRLLNRELRREMEERKHAEKERQQLELQVQHSQKLESLGVLAGGIAHDFNNLLTGILGNTTLVLKETPNENQEQIRECLEDVELAAKQATELAKQMLAYSGKGHFIVGQVELRVVIGETQRLLESAVSKKVRLRYDFADTSTQITADAAQIRQVLINLVTNASDAIGDGTGEVVVRTGCMFCSAEWLEQAYLGHQGEPGDYCFIEVVDDGEGMDQETASKIFDPFFTTKFAGRGLGLSAVLGIVRGHQGVIRVDSGDDRGTSIRVLFPRSLEKTEQVEEKTPPAGATQLSGTVLLVDDEATVRSTVGRMLRRLGLKVVVAADGAEALSVYGEDPDRISCVLLDMTMPQMDGHECLSRLRQLNKDVRVILSSGYNAQTFDQRLKDEGSIEFIQKPYSADLLAQKMICLLES